VMKTFLVHAEREVMIPITIFCHENPGIIIFLN
jgi:hypothetical protein